MRHIHGGNAARQAAAFFPMNTATTTVLPELGGSWAGLEGLGRRPADIPKRSLFLLAHSAVWGFPRQKRRAGFLYFPDHHAYADKTRGPKKGNSFGHVDGGQGEERLHHGIWIASKLMQLGRSSPTKKVMVWVPISQQWEVTKGLGAHQSPNHATSVT